MMHMWTTVRMSRRCEQVELLSWQSDNDISGDGGVLRTVMSEGSGWETPNDNDEVTREKHTAPSTQQFPCVRAAFLPLCDVRGCRARRVDELCYVTRYRTVRDIQCLTAALRSYFVLHPLSRQSSRSHSRFVSSSTDCEFSYRGILSLRLLIHLISPL